MRMSLNGPKASFAAVQRNVGDWGKATIRNSSSALALGIDLLRNCSIISRGDEFVRQHTFATVSLRHRKPCRSEAASSES